MPSPTSRNPSPSSTGAASDFDFFVGSWQIHHSRLKERLTGCLEWEQFEGSSVMQKLLGGHANVDDKVIHIPDGNYRALTIRSFDAASGLWSIWWLDGRHPGRLDVPVVVASRMARAISTPTTPTTAKPFAFASCGPNALNWGSHAGSKRSPSMGASAGKSTG